MRRSGAAASALARRRAGLQVGGTVKAIAWWWAALAAATAALGQGLDGPGAPPAAAAAEMRPELRALLTPVPVFFYQVGADAYLTVAGGADGGRAIPVFFLAADARAFLAENGGAAPQGAQLRMSDLGEIYENALRAAGDPTGPRFVFSANAEAAEDGLAVLRAAGLPGRIARFPGVPLFTAKLDGEFVALDGYTPFFFSKRDLDTALASMPAEVRPRVAVEVSSLAELADALGQAPADVLGNFVLIADRRAMVERQAVQGGTAPDDLGKPPAQRPPSERWSIQRGPAEPPAPPAPESETGAPRPQDAPK